MTIAAFDLILILGALLCFALGLGYFFLKEGKRSLGRRLLLFNGALLCSIFLLELFYSRYNDEAVKLSLLIVDSIKSLRMSADYNEVTKQVEVFGTERLDTALRLFRTWVYMMVPVTGFTLVYDVVAGFSPALKLFFLRRRPMFVFSQLNERSLLLAEDIAKRKKADKPLLVFTDCGDGSSKLYQSAKAIGAVCLEEPLKRCDEFGKSRLCCLFLMQQGKDGIDDEENISMLRGLLSAETASGRKKTAAASSFSPTPPTRWRACGLSSWTTKRAWARRKTPRSKYMLCATLPKAAHSCWTGSRSGALRRILRPVSRCG